MNNMLASIVIILILVAFILYVVIRYFQSGGSISTPTTVTIVGPIMDARSPKTVKDPVPLSLNEKEGMVFSYSGWLLIEDWMYRQGSLRCIFNKGSADSSSECPGLYLDATSNAMILKVNTYGDTETLQIPNLPARKWIHFVVVIDQNAVNVYIDGILRVYHSLAKLPRQNKGSVFVAPAGGWAGQIGTLTYHRYALDQGEVSRLMAVAPYEDTTKSKIPLPPYFDTTWYLGRF
jgi:hypothetical protein